jgi:hypothetical protein
MRLAEFASHRLLLLIEEMLKDIVGTVCHEDDRAVLIA